MRAITSFKDLISGSMGNAVIDPVIGDWGTLDENWDEVDPDGPVTTAFKQDGYSICFCDDPAHGRFGVSVFKNGQANMMVASSVAFPAADKEEHEDFEVFAEAFRNALSAGHLVLACHDIKNMKIGFLSMESPVPVWNLIEHSRFAAAASLVEKEILADADSEASRDVA